MNPNNRTASAGKRGDKIRSDCYIEIIQRKSAPLKINSQSKVETMYGDSIADLIDAMCVFFDLRHADISIEDYGALPFTIAARFEAALKRLNPQITAEFLLPARKKRSSGTTRDRLRRSRLYLPGNEPKFYPNAGLHKPDGIILDLEDSVSLNEKDAAQYLVRNALRSIDFYGAERMVRINQLPRGLGDLRFVVPYNVDVILIPKCESAEAVIEVDNEVRMLKSEHGIRNEIYYMPIIESALGVVKSYEIATASPLVCALAVGLEDYTADIGVERTNEGRESLFARSMIINSAKAAGIQAIDTVFSEVNDEEGLKNSVIEAKALGFEGKGCIHPRQIKIVHEAFAPTEAEIEKAKKVVLAFNEAERKGIGVISVGSKMIDAPVVKRARRIIQLAIMNNLLAPDWDKK